MLAHSEPVNDKRYGQSYGASVTRKTLISRELPAAIGHETYGNEYLKDMLWRTEPVLRFVEDAMTEARTKQYSDEAIDEERVKKAIFHLLFLIEFSHEEVGKSQSYEPAHGVPAHGEPSDTNHLGIRIPCYVTQYLGHLSGVFKFMSIGVLTIKGYTLNLKCIISPSCTT